MVPHVYSDGEEAPLKRPKRVVVPSAKVISADNAADQELPSHRRAHNASHAANLPTSLGSARVTITEVDDEDNEIALISSSKQAKRLIKGTFFISLEVGLSLALTLSISFHYYRQKTSTQP